MNKDTANLILKKVEEDYNLISVHFSNTRYFFWKEFYQFTDYLKNGDKILDLGCGNGRLLHFFAGKDISYIGVDFSEELIKIAKEKAQEKKEHSQNFPDYQFIRNDFNHLPFKDGSFNLVFAIASLYHIPSYQLRLKAFQEISRVLKPKGRLIMTYWNMWKKSRINLVIKNILRKFSTGSKLDFFDAERPWKNSDGKILTKRYCHAFSLKEITRLANKTGLIIEKKYYSKKGKKIHFWQGDNGVVMARKIVDNRLKI